MENGIIESERYKEHTITIAMDYNPLHPRLEWDHLGTVVYWHREYILGEIDGEKAFGHPRDFWEWAKQNQAFYYPVFLYDHTVQRVKIGSFEGLLPQGHAQFDTMQVGYIYVTRETLENEGIIDSVPEDELESRVREILETEINELDTFLSGQVYCFTVEDANGEIVDSLCGIYSIDDAIEEAKGIVDHLVTNEG